MQVAPRRSERTKRDRVVTGVTRIKVNKVSTVLDNSLEMGGICSSQRVAEKKKTKQLEGRVKLYEAGITDSSLHASQTNIGLLNVVLRRTQADVIALQLHCGAYLRFSQ